MIFNFVSITPSFFFLPVKRILLTIERKQLNRSNNKKKKIYIYNMKDTPFWCRCFVAGSIYYVVSGEPIVPLISKGSEPVSKGCEKSSSNESILNILKRITLLQSDFAPFQYKYLLSYSFSRIFLFANNNEKRMF